MSDEIEVGLSEDGTKFTVVTESDDLGAISNELDPDDPKPGESDEFFDFDSVPEDQREVLKATYDKMKSAFSEKSAKASDVDVRLQTANAMLEKLNAASSQFVGGKQSLADKKEEVERKLNFKFQENDYYAPVFQEVMGAINELKTSITGIDEKVVSGKQEATKESVQKFMSDNKITEGSTVFNKMNDLTKELGPGSIRNLPRLHKLAKMELGLPLETPKPVVLPQKKVGIKRQVETPGMRKGATREREVKTMEDAFNLALEQQNEE